MRLGKSDDPTPANTVTFSGFEVCDNCAFQIGKTGPTNGVTIYDDVIVEDNEVFRIGPYTSLDERREDFRRMMEDLELISR
jgi:hypothetical protein